MMHMRKYIIDSGCACTSKSLEGFDSTGCLSALSAQFSQPAEQARSAASAQFLRGMSPEVATESNPFFDQLEDD